MNETISAIRFFQDFVDKNRKEAALRPRVNPVARVEDMEFDCEYTASQYLKHLWKMQAAIELVNHAAALLEGCDLVPDAAGDLRSALDDSCTDGVADALKDRLTEYYSDLPL